MTISQILADVRLALDEPNHQHPTERHLFTFLMHQVQHFHNEMQNTGENWDVNSFILTVQPSVSDYEITTALAPRFSKPIYVLTSKSNDPTFNQHEVPIWDIQNFDLPPGKAGSMPWLTEMHSACAMGFYQQGGMGKCYVKVAPVPTASVEYEIWYEGGVMPMLDLASTVLMPEHHHLLVYRTAISALPMTKWDGLINTPDLHIAKQNLLLGILREQEQRYDEAFQRHKNNMRQEQMAPRLLYGENSDGWW